MNKKAEAKRKPVKGKLKKTRSKKKLSLRIKEFWTQPGHRAKKTAAIVAVLLALLLVAGGIFVWSKLAMIEPEEEQCFEESTEEDPDVEKIGSITDAYSLNDFLYKWATDGGEKMYSDSVKNILLIGKDSRSGLSDSIILLSVNEKAKKLTLVSFFRDSYTYMEPKGSKGCYAKINAAYSKGGAKCLIETLENDYKIRIDDSVMVDYNSFPKLIDALGGVNVRLTPKEAEYLNRNWREVTMSGRRASFNSGMNRLDGEKALMFCRIRHLDSDVNRTERQRRLISSVIDEFKTASLSKVNSAINVLLPNIKTSLTKREILSTAAKAVSDGWLRFSLRETSMPQKGFAKGGYAGSQWIWIVDYEACAYRLQTLLYGHSNIELSPDRVSPIGLKTPPREYYSDLEPQALPEFPELPEKEAQEALRQEEQKQQGEQGQQGQQGQQGAEPSGGGETQPPEGQKEELPPEQEPSSEEQGGPRGLIPFPRRNQ